MWRYVLWWDSIKQSKNLYETALVKAAQDSKQGSYQADRNRHCLTRSDVTSVERGVRMSQCGQAPLGMRIEGVGVSHFS